MTRHQTVAELVRRRCPDADLLLEMIGVTLDGQLQPDDDRDYGDVDTAQLGERSKGGKVAAAFDDMRTQPAVSFAPDTLRHLPPPVAIPHVGRLPLAECPSKAARKRHRRHSQSCDVCGVTTA